MSKELEALERYGYHYVNGKKDYKIIEDALKALEIKEKYDLLKEVLS